MRSVTSLSYAFWLVGAVSIGLLPSLVKSVFGGDEEVVTTCLAVFSISIAIGSGLAAWLAAGRIILLPTILGAVLLGVFAIDLGWSTRGVAPIADFVGYLAMFRSGRGIRLAIDLAGPLLFLASAASDFYTGHTLYADGGYTAG